MNQLTDAYAAGLIDGEGCISIAVKRMSGRPTESLTPRVDVGMTIKALPTLRALHATYGGYLAKSRSKTDRWEEAWCWRLFGDPLAGFLTRILPHLRMKRRQAELALSLQRMLVSLRTGRAKERCIWTTEGRRQAQSIYALVTELNRKGPALDDPSGWFARRVGPMWLTPNRNLFSPTGWDEFSETFPRSGTMRSGRLFVRPTWAPLIAVSESLSSHGDATESWPTPMSYGHGAETSAPGQTKLDIRVLGRYQDDPKYWPTATAGDAKSSGSRNLHGSKAHPGVSLTDAVTTGGSTEPRRWPTPRAHDAESPGGFDTVSEGGPSLPTMVRLSGRETWPTPSATPYGSSQNGINGKGGEFARPSAGTPSLETIAKAEGGKLNPSWVEALMGLPVGWTDGLPVPAKRSTRGSRRGPSPDAPPTATPDSERSGTPSSPPAPRSSGDES